MKKRFELFDEELEFWIHDHETNKIFGTWDLDYLTDLLNEQNEKIKELKQENEQLKLDLKMFRSIYCDEINERDEKIKELEKIVSNGNQKLEDKFFEDLKNLDEEYNTDLNERLKEIEDLKQENKQLKQSQNNKAIEVLEEIFDFYRDSECEQLVAPKEDEEIYFLDYLKDKLNKLKGEK